MVERILLLVFRMKTLKQKIMTREDRLKQCRYYKGGYNCPESLDVMEVGFWIAEESFVSAEEWVRNDIIRLLSISGLNNYRQKWQGLAEDENHCNRILLYDKKFRGGLGSLGSLVCETYSPPLFRLDFYIDVSFLGSNTHKLISVFLRR